MQRITITRIVIAVLAVAGLVWALCFSPRARQRQMLDIGQAWQEAHAVELQAVSNEYPKVWVLLSTNCRFYVSGIVDSEEQRQDIVRRIDELRPPLQVMYSCRVAEPSEERLKDDE